MLKDNYENSGSGSICQMHGSADLDPDPAPHQKCHGSATMQDRHANVFICSTDSGAIERGKNGK